MTPREYVLQREPRAEIMTWRGGVVVVIARQGRDQPRLSAVQPTETLAWEGAAEVLRRFEDPTSMLVKLDEVLNG